MRIVLFIIFSFGTFCTTAQEKLISANYKDEILTDALEDIEDQLGERIFFESSSFDTLKTTARFEKENIDKVFNLLFEDIKVNVLFTEYGIVLSRSHKFITHFPVLSHLQSEEKNKEDYIPKGVIFKEDYQANNSQKQTILEIGNRAQASVDGISTVVGYVKNKENGEPVVGALVYCTNPTKTAVTDTEGFYSMRLPNGRLSIQISSLEMMPERREIVLLSDAALNIDMMINTMSLNEVVINSDRTKNVNQLEMGVRKINVAESKNIPMGLGENDIMKVATTTAGVQSMGEAGAGYNVRGGKSDQNLILWNGAPVYNANHFLGFFSVFNSDAVTSMEIYKSSIPTKYGGRLSSVFDVSGKKGSMEKFQIKGGVSPVTAKLLIETPVIADVSSLLVSGRATYSNWLLNRVDNVDFSANKVSFYDLSVKYDHKVNDKNSFDLSVYYSDDEFRVSSDTLFSFSNINYQNLATSAHWKHMFGEKLQGELEVYMSDYGYQIEFDESVINGFTQGFGINEKGASLNLDYLLSKKHNLLFGGSFKNYKVDQGYKRPLVAESDVLGVELQNNYAHEYALNISDQYTLSDKFGMSLGIRYTIFRSIGERDVQTYFEGQPKNASSVNGIVHFDKGETIKTFQNPEYRFSIRYKLNESSSLKFGLNRNVQNVHALSNAATLSPSDTWTLSGYHLKPQIADQISLGYFKNIQLGKYEFSLEGYYKHMQNLIDFKVGGDFLLNDHIELAAIQGLGKAYGVEASIRKSGKLNGWINYTYARTLIQLDGEHAEEKINGGAFYPTNYDKPHTFNLVANYKFTRRISLSSNVVFYTGVPVTVPAGIYDFNESQLVHYSNRNEYRIPNYFRIDLGFSLEESHKVVRPYHAFWSFSIYNLLGRDNAYSVFFDIEDQNVSAYQLTVFGNPIPTISYNFRF